MNKIEFRLWERLFRFTRPSVDPLVPAVTGLVRAAAQFSERTRFTVTLDERGARKFDGTEESIHRVLRSSMQRFGGPGFKGIADPEALLEVEGPVSAFALATDADEALIVLRYMPDPLAPAGSNHLVEFSFDLDRPLVGPAGHFSFDELWRLFAAAATGFGARWGAVLDSQLMEIVNWRIANEESLRRLPRSERKHFHTDWPYSQVPGTLVERLSRIRHPLYFDLHEVPPAVWWLNYWTARHVAAIGEERVRAAPWARIEEQPDGALLLATQEEAFDATNTVDLERIARILEMLELYDVQGRYLVKSAPRDA